MYILYIHWHLHSSIYNMSMHTWTHANRLYMYTCKPRLMAFASSCCPSSFKRDLPTPVYVWVCSVAGPVPLGGVQVGEARPGTSGRDGAGAIDPCHGGTRLGSGSSTALGSPQLAACTATSDQQGLSRNQQ